MGVSVGGTRVWVGTIGVDVGELQEDSRNKKVMKFMKRLMLQIIWKTMQGGQDYSCPPKWKRWNVKILWSETPEFSTFHIIPCADQNAPLIL
jgi:hypothetical protein